MQEKKNKKKNKPPKTFGAKIQAPRKEQLRPKNQTGFRGIQNCSATCPVALPPQLRNFTELCGTESHANKLKNTFNKNSYYFSAVLPCTTRVARAESPKDLTSERTSSFLGKSLRSRRGNLLGLFEC